MSQPQDPGQPDPYAPPPAGGEPPATPQPYVPPEPAGQPPYTAPPPYAPPPGGQPPYAAPPPYGQQPYPTPGYGYAPPAAGYASWIQRVGAYLVDLLVIGVPGGLLIGVGAAVGGGGGAFLLVIGYLVLIGLWLWNYVFRQGNTGQTIGKEQLGIKLIRESDGQPVGPGMSFARGVAHVVDNLACYIGWLWPLWDAKSQTFADKICSTVVVRV